MGALLVEGNVKGALENVMPSELFAMVKDYMASGKAGDASAALELRAWRPSRRIS